MSDRWYGWLNIEHAPDEWVTQEKRGTQEHHYMADLLALEAIPERIRLALEELGFGDVSRDGHMLSLSDDQFAGGSWAIIESDLPEALMEAGLAFRGGDDGMYENSGCEWWWKPGMDGVEHRTAAASEGIVLTLSQVWDLWNDEAHEVAARVLRARDGDEGARESTVEDAVRLAELVQQLHGRLTTHFDVEALVRPPSGIVPLEASS